MRIVLKTSQLNEMHPGGLLFSIGYAQMGQTNAWPYVTYYLEDRRFLAEDVGSLPIKDCPDGSAENRPVKRNAFGKSPVFRKIHGDRANEMLVLSRFFSAR